VPPARASAAIPWKVQVARVALRAGSVNWRDETLASPADIRLTGLVVDATAIALPFAAGAPLQFSGSVGLDPLAANAPASSQAAASPALLAFKGTATDQAAQLTADLKAWPLGMAAKYVGHLLLPALHGQLDAQLGVNWQAASGDKPQVLQITAPQIAVSDVQLAQGKVSLVSVKRVDLAQVDIDVTGQTFKAARLQLTEPKAKVDRDSDKRWMYERWMATPGMAAQPPAPPPPTDAATRVRARPGPWPCNDVQLEGGAMSFSDKAGAKPVTFEVTAAKARLGGLLLDDRPASRAQAAKPVPLTASLRLATGRFEPGKVDFNGSLALAPLQAQGRLLVDRLPVQAFEPYFADTLNIELLRADASFKGRVAYRQTPAGPQAQVTGDVSLEELRANTLAPSEDLLAWKALNLRGLHVALDPAKATRVEVKETVLTDFFARLIVMPDGRINLQDLVKGKETQVAAVSRLLLPRLHPGCRIRAGRQKCKQRSPGFGSGGTAAHRELRPHQPDQRQGAVLRPFRQTQLLGRPDRPDRQAQRFLVGAAGRPGRRCGCRAEHGGPGTARARRGHGLARNPGQAQPAGQAAGAGHQGQGARPRTAAAVAVLRQILGLRHRTAASSAST
jgi:hypothetical protein